MKRRIANRFRQIVSGSPDGKPDWVKLIARGEGIGLFGPGSAVWQVHGTVATLVGGIRALLLQATHPAALTGVSQHSRYESDPLGRLAGTSRWLTITTFGSTGAIANEAARVNAMHDHVKGEFQSKSGEVRSYRAAAVKCNNAHSCEINIRPIGPDLVPRPDVTSRQDRKSFPGAKIR